MYQFVNQDYNYFYLLHINVQYNKCSNRRAKGLKC